MKKLDRRLREEEAARERQSKARSETERETGKRGEIPLPLLNPSSSFLCVDQTDTDVHISSSAPCERPSNKFTILPAKMTKITPD